MEQQLGQFMYVIGEQTMWLYAPNWWLFSLTHIVTKPGNISHWACPEYVKYERIRLRWETTGQWGDDRMCYLEWTWEAWHLAPPGIQRGGAGSWREREVNGDALAVSLNLMRYYTKKKQRKPGGLLCNWAEARVCYRKEPYGTATTLVSPCNEVGLLAHRDLEIS
jgi:hypothetical protein